MELIILPFSFLFYKVLNVEISNVYIIIKMPGTIPNFDYILNIYTYFSIIIITPIYLFKKFH